LGATRGLLPVHSIRAGYDLEDSPPGGPVRRARAIVQTSAQVKLCQSGEWLSRHRRPSIRHPPGNLRVVPAMGNGNRRRAQHGESRRRCACTSKRSQPQQPRGARATARTRRESRCGIPGDWVRSVQGISAAITAESHPLLARIRFSLKGDSACVRRARRAVPVRWHLVAERQVAALPDSPCGVRCTDRNAARGCPSRLPKVMASCA